MAPSAAPVAWQSIAVATSRDPLTAEFGALIVRLGGQALADPIPVGLHADIVTLGSLAGVAVWGVMLPARAMLRVARQFARQGRLGAMFGWDVPSARWSVAITIQPVHAVIVARGDVDALPFRRLAESLRHDRATPLERAISLADALDVDAAGRRTFRMLHDLVERAVSCLPCSVPRDDRHAWTLVQFTRLLFLRFAESEGWLDGNPRFLADTFDRCLLARRDPQRQLLDPLFFGTLNRTWNQRSRFAQSLGAIPFLNGGLFEPHPVERSNRLRLPVDYWRDAFAALVDRVDVTLDQRTDDGRVTPELLGRVFEGVMHPLERKQEGAFFTPPSLVDGVLREALACHLAPRLQLSESAVEAALDHPAPPMLAALLDVTVLDPSVGSGAFLIGALGLLHGPGPRILGRVRHLVTRRLFGVDRHPVAVRICELRLWLEVLRAMRGRPPHRVPPLPNLDANVRAGDALIDPLFNGAIDNLAARAILRRQRAIVAAHGASKRTAIAAARVAERTAMLRAMAIQESTLDRAIEDLLVAARAPTLFGDRPRMSAITRRGLKAYRRRRPQIRAERRRIARDQAATPFALSAAFAPILAQRHGFDLVVGNPPWVRAERLAPATRDALVARFRWWRSGAGRGWRHLPDLAVAFVERGFGLLAPRGTLALLLPAKLATAGYATACRSALVAQATIHRVADLGSDPRAGFDATTYPLALIASRSAPSRDHVVRLGLGIDSPTQAQMSWHDAPAWNLRHPDAQRIAARLAREHPAFAEFAEAKLGIKTGANVAFLDPPTELHRWCRPAVRGRDIRPFRARPGALLLWPADSRGVPWKTLPAAVARYLGERVGRLERRADQHWGPWWQLFRTRAATAEHRVVWRDLAPELQAATMPDMRGVPLNSCYVAPTASAVIAESLAAWLNSRPIRALARLAAEPAAGGCARFAARVVHGLPLPRDVPGNVVLAAFAHSAIDHDVQAALDECAADLLGLNAAERDLLVDLAANRR
jgi:hypothetical protein